MLTAIPSEDLVKTDNYYKSKTEAVFGSLTGCQLNFSMCSF